ncbi:MAG TPA: hypothetical protein VMU46_02065 [Burkholderiales bacterium]|nr:hypothetical protein [Burkholderiales bacterium]
MTSPRRIEANRRNARASTGPRTAAGKARARMNALRHGLAAGAASRTDRDRVARLARLLGDPGGRNFHVALALAGRAVEIARVRAAEVRLVARWHALTRAEFSRQRRGACAPDDDTYAAASDALLASMLALGRYAGRARAGHRRALAACGAAIAVAERSQRGSLAERTQRSDAAPSAPGLLRASSGATAKYCRHCCEGSLIR